MLSIKIDWDRFIKDRMWFGVRWYGNQYGWGWQWDDWHRGVVKIDRWEWLF